MGSVVSPFVFANSYILHPASHLMKANLRINFRRICFDAVTSRQPTAASQLELEKSEKRLPFGPDPTEPAARSPNRPVLIFVNSPAGWHLSYETFNFAIEWNWILQYAQGPWPEAHFHTDTTTPAHTRALCISIADRHTPRPTPTACYSY